MTNSSVEQRMKADWITAALVEMSPAESLDIICEVDSTIADGSWTEGLMGRLDYTFWEESGTAGEPHSSVRHFCQWLMKQLAILEDRELRERVRVEVDQLMLRFPGPHGVDDPLLPGTIREDNQGNVSWLLVANNSKLQWLAIDVGFNATHKLGDRVDMDDLNFGSFEYCQPLPGSPAARAEIK